jgi:tetratricopeptide (TPR) repeat protein
LDSRVREWRITGGRHRATEVVTAALVAGHENHPDALDAATTLVGGVSTSSLQDALARQYLGYPDAPRDSDREDADVGHRAQRRVASLRAIVRREPRNAVRWVDLGREYLVLGLLEQAEKCLRVALSLQPDNRFVLRSAAHLFAHVGDERAAQLALDRPVSNIDPWLLSTRIALSEGGTLVRVARRMIADGDIPPWHAGELAGVLATYELSSGRERDGRSLLRRALVNPTENVLAHAVWVAERSGVDVEVLSLPHPERPYEAHARTFEREQKWADAATAAAQWLADQPFSLDAAAFASVYALANEDFNLAINVTSEGLRANKDEPLLLNNRAFARANIGELGAAVADLTRLARAQPDPVCRSCATATAGLVLFRVGNYEQGRRMYEAAIDSLQRLHRSDLVARATAHLASEERFARTPYAEAMTARARQSLARTDDVATHDVCNRLLDSSRGVQPLIPDARALRGTADSPSGFSPLSSLVSLDPLIAKLRSIE